MTCNISIRTALLAACLAAALTLTGCGRRGLPVPLDPSVAAKADATKPAAPRADPTANSQKPLPHGVDDNALKAGAPRSSTPFDFLL